MTVWYTWSEGNMFDFEGPFAAEKTTVVRRSQAKQSIEQSRRDIYDSHRHRVFALAFYMTGNELDAEDILSRTFIQAFKTVPEPDAQGVDSALVANLRSRFPIGEKEAMAVASSGSNLGCRNVRRTDLEEAIQYLPATERLVFLLLDVEGYSLESAASLLEIPKVDVLRAAFSARIRMREVLASSSRYDAAA